MTFLSACNKQNNSLININLDKKYCEFDDDCVTSCGGEEGRGDCFNKKFVSFNNPPDNICCACENCAPCYTCACEDNVCTSEKSINSCC